MFYDPRMYASCSGGQVLN